jgi:HEAT repeat protein
MFRSLSLVAGAALLAALVSWSRATVAPVLPPRLPGPAPVLLVPAAPLLAVPMAPPEPPRVDPPPPRQPPPDEEQRSEECLRLGRDPSLEAKWELLARVNAEAPRVREAAAFSLASRNGDPDVRWALERRIRIDPVKNVRVAAARALGR